MIDQHLTDRNKALVRSFYEGGTDSEAKAYGEIFLPEFEVTAPNYLPWGGTSNLQAYLDDVLHQVTAVLDFKRCEIISLVGENEHIIILINIALVGTADRINISEHWTIKDNKALSLWVAYFEPEALMQLIAKNAAAAV
ncbi:nuclear transport factor 2-like protein [Mucilaginibacter ginsenosidivorax]|uniref:Nuclear transport factor 2 family protein n=1 Tax=Mucilaginibacter ginsenosidivorax TaxID=862126 RepID=A0A5B8VT01_9SPHI|nr:hypothetical protein [Mucilaginibacter ginsenosidivorax]QEC74774.1 hypothetical protein FSB76_01990 [Mucilaginibacter ginsenosidivorax]